MSASPVNEAFTVSTGTFMAFYGNNQLTVVNLSSGAVKNYSLEPWTQEFTLTSGTGSAAENILAFYAAGSLTIVNLSGQTENSYTVGASTEEWTAGSVLAFYDNGLLTTVDTGSGAFNTYSIGAFSQEISASTTSTGASATPNVLAFYQDQTLTTINVQSKNQVSYDVGDFSQQWTLGVGSSTNAQTVLAFYTGGKLTAINLVTQAAATYDIGAGQTQSWTAGSVVGFFTAGQLTTVDVGSGAVNSYGIGSFVDEFTLSSAGSGATVTPNILAFYGNQTLTTINVMTQDVQSYKVGNFTQEWQLAVANSQSVLAFDSGSTITAVNVATNSLASYSVDPNSVQEWTAGSVVALYAGGTLTTVDVGSGQMHSFTVGPFSDAFTATFGTAASAQTLIAFYDRGSGALTAVNLTNENQTPSEIVGSWTQEWASSGMASTTAILAFYNKGVLTAEDLSTGNIEKYPVGIFNDEWTLAPQAIPQGVLAFYNQDGTVTTANLALGTTSTFPAVGLWSEEWTGSSIASSTVTGAMGMTGAASAASGSNVLVFYNAGAVSALDVAAGTFTSLFELSSTAQEAQPEVVAALPTASTAVDPAQQPDSIDPDDLLQEFRTFKSNMTAVRSEAITMTRSTAFRAERAELKTFVMETRSLLNLNFTQIIKEIEKLKSNVSKTRTATLTANLTLLKSRLSSKGAVLFEILAPAGGGATAGAQGDTTGAQGKVASEIDVAKSIVENLLTQSNM